MEGMKEEKTCTEMKTKMNTPKENKIEKDNDDNSSWKYYYIIPLCLMVILPSTLLFLSKSENDLTQSMSAILNEDSMIHRFLRVTNSHKDLFPLGTTDYLGLFFSTLGLMIAAGGGVGGGGVLVPIFILIMRFKAKHAIPLSNITVLGGAFANAYLNLSKRHPLIDRPLVDWDLILIMEPLAIAGALLGAFLNKVLNELVLMVSLVVLLSFTAYTSLSKAMKMYKKESKIILEKESELTVLARKEEENKEEEMETLIDHMEDSNAKQEEDLELFEDPRLQKLLEKEREIPMYNVYVLSILFVAIMVMNVLKGGQAFPSPLGIQCGSTSFWLANLIMILMTVYGIILARNHLIQQYYLKKDLTNYPKIEGDIDWNERNTIIYPIICLTAGFFAGMFGVGGGIVKGPLMLAMGVHPSVASATSACMILFTSLTATTSFIVFGLMIFDYSIACFIVGFIATFVGQVILNQMMKKNNRNSYIAFSIGFIVLLSAFLMTIQSMISMIEGNSGGGGGVCT